MKLTKAQWAALGLSLATGILFSVLRVTGALDHLYEWGIDLRFEVLRGEKQGVYLRDKEGTIKLDPKTGRPLVKMEYPERVMKDIHIVGITTDSINIIGPWPIKWEYYAEFIRAISPVKKSQPGPAAILVDILLLDNRPGAGELAEAIKAAGNVSTDYPFETTDYPDMEDFEARLNALISMGSLNVTPEGEVLDNVKDPKLPVWVKAPHPPIIPIMQNSFVPGFANIEVSKKTGVNRKMPLLLRWDVDTEQGKYNFYFPNIDLVVVCKYYDTDCRKDLEVVPGEYVKIKNIPKKMVRDWSKDDPAAKREILWGKEDRTVTIPIDERGFMDINFTGDLFSFPESQLHEFTWEGRQFIRREMAKSEGKKTVSPEDLQVSPQTVALAKKKLPELAGQVKKGLTKGQLTAKLNAVLSEILAGKKIPPGTYAKEFEDKIILLAMYYATGVGTSQDIHASPFDAKHAGIEHHANAINTILSQDFVHHVPEWVNILIFMLVAALGGLVVPRVNTSIAFVAFLAIEIGIIIGTLAVFEWTNYLHVFLGAMAETGAVFVLLIVVRVLTEEANTKYIRQTFSKFVSKDVVNELLKDPNKLKLGGEKKEITVMFSDVRGFTTISENLSPEQLVAVLNEYLSEMSEIILTTKGTIDKYIGDAIMAFWGAPVPLENHAHMACWSALQQLNKLNELRSYWQETYGVELNIGLGLNTGPAVVGNMGSSHRMDYTLMGDTVNLGSRLEGATKMYSIQFMISEYTYEQVKDKVVARELDRIRVKGKHEPVVIYEVLDVEQPDAAYFATTDED